MTRNTNKLLAQLKAQQGAQNHAQNVEFSQRKTAGIIQTVNPASQLGNQMNASVYTTTRACNKFSVQVVQEANKFDPATRQNILNDGANIAALNAASWKQTEAELRVGNVSHTDNPHAQRQNAKCTVLAPTVRR